MQREWFPEPLWETLASHLGVHVSGDRGQALTAQEFALKYFPMMWDPEGELLLRKMDALGIDATVMLVDDFGLALGEAAISIEGQNKAFADLARRHAHPLLLDAVCSDFPDLKIVAAHSGRPLMWETVASMAAIHFNLHGDLAGWQTMVVRDRPRFRQILRRFIDIAGVEKILWGTDDPVYDVLIPTRQYLDAMRALPDDTSDGLRFTRAEIDAILGDNAARLFGL